MQKIVRQNESESRNKRYSATIDKNICEQLEKEVRRINMTVEEKIYKEVKRRCELPSNAYGIGAWDHHIKIVYELAKKYASEYGANQEIVSLAALLHDVASVTDVTYTEEHHIIGAKIAEELLLQENYPIEKIEQIKKCILNNFFQVFFHFTQNLFFNSGNITLRYPHCICNFFLSFFNMSI